MLSERLVVLYCFAGGNHLLFPFPTVLVLPCCSTLACLFAAHVVTRDRRSQTSDADRVDGSSNQRRQGVAALDAQIAHEAHRYEDPAVAQSRDEDPEGVSGTDVATPDRMAAVLHEDSCHHSACIQVRVSVRNR